MVLHPTLVTTFNVDWIGLCSWAAPAFLLAPLLIRSPKGERATWALVGFVLALIWVDKTLDLQAWVHQTGQELVRAFDPEWRLRGPHLWVRWVLVGSAFLAVVVVFARLVRRDQHIGLAKVLTLTGLLGIAGFVSVRHLPALQDIFAAGLERWIEWGCLALVWIGLTCGLLGTRGLPRGGAS